MGHPVYYSNQGNKNVCNNYYCLIVTFKESVWSTTPVFYLLFLQPILTRRRHQVEPQNLQSKIGWVYRVGLEKQPWPQQARFVDEAFISFSELLELIIQTEQMFDSFGILNFIVYC